MSTFTSAEALSSGFRTETAPLLPRYRRPLSFGAILDETFRVFRRAWRPLIIVMACAAVPIGLITALGSALLSGSFFQYMDAASAATEAEDFGPLLGMYGGIYGGSTAIAIVSALFITPAYAAVVFITDGELRGRPLSAMDALKQGLRATPPLLLLGLLGVLLTVLLVIASVPLLLLWVVPGLFGLTPLIGAIVWAANPKARRPWLCWLVILTTPFGLLIYFAYRWMLTLPAVALERIGPVEALRRSMTLTRGHWFRVFGSFTVLGVISSVLQAIPGLLIAAIVLLLSFLGAFSQAGSDGGSIADDPTGLISSIYTATNVGSAAAQALGTALVGALPPIALTLLFQDGRNRHEGADLTERLDAATGTPAAPATPPVATTGTGAADSAAPADDASRDVPATVSRTP